MKKWKDKTRSGFKICGSIYGGDRDLVYVVEVSGPNIISSYYKAIRANCYGQALGEDDSNGAFDLVEDKPVKPKLHAHMSPHGQVQWYEPASFGEWYEPASFGDTVKSDWIRRPEFDIEAK